MNGFGSQPFGSSSYGLGEPVQAPASSGTILRDPFANVSTGSRAIDAATHDYVLDPSAGRIRGMGNTQQLVLIAVNTLVRSSAMRQLGIHLLSIAVITDNFKSQVRAQFDSALAHLTSRHLVEILDVSVTRLPSGAAKIALNWRDIATNQVHNLEV